MNLLKPTVSLFLSLNKPEKIQSCGSNTSTTSSLRSGADSVTLRFGASKDPSRRAAIHEARIKSAKALGVSVENPAKFSKTELDALRQQFVNAYFQNLATSLVEIGEAFYQDNTGRESLYSLLGDMNLTEDDFCNDKLLLGSAVDFVEDDGCALSWTNVLGYKDIEAYEKDLPRFLKPTADKLGLTDAKLSDKLIVQTLQKLNVDEIERRFPVTLEPKPHAFWGKTFVITGTLPSLSRADAEAKIKAVGGKIGSTVK